MKWWRKVSQRNEATSQSESGVETLTKLIAVHRSHLTWEENEKYLTRATDQFKRHGTPGADALAELISELVACRCEDVVYALIVAESVSPSPKLVSVLRDLSTTASSNPRVAPPHPQRFQSELVGAGQIAWGTSTATRLGHKATEVLAKIAPDKLAAKQEEMSGQRHPPTAGAALPSGNKVGAAKDSKTAPETLAALATWATPIAYDDVADTREAIDVLIAVAENPSTPVKTLEAICDRHHIGFWELTHNPNCPAHVLKKIAACDNPFTAGCARSHRNFPK